MSAVNELLANENTLAPAATGNEGNESFESGFSTPESTAGDHK